jgi:hypothetical protein
VRARTALLALGLGLVLAALAPASARALDECRGLQECVSVVGPWVAVPAREDGTLVSVAWELRCPLPGYVVGGTDARVTTRAVEVSIRGEKGSPVSPGVTTRRSVLFTARIASRGSAVAFLPAIGCMPSDGGGGRSQTAVGRARAVVQPGTPLSRRVAVGRLRPGATRTVVARCPAGSRLVESGHAVGFRTKAPPSAAVLGSVRTRESRVGSSVRVAATLGASVARSVPVLLQVHAVCARGGP